MKEACSMRVHVDGCANVAICDLGPKLGLPSGKLAAWLIDYR